MTKEAELLKAIQAGDITTVEALLDSDGSLLNHKAGHEVPMVLMALYYNQPRIAEVFAERGAELDIFAAAALGRVERVAELATHDPALVNAVAGDGFQPLGLASFFGQAEVARYLILKGARVNSPSHNPMRVMPLHSASAGNHLAVAKVLLEAGADPNAAQADEFVPIHAAAQNGNAEMIRLLLEYGADPTLETSDGSTAVDFARQSGSDEVLAALK